MTCKRGHGSFVSYLDFFLSPEKYSVSLPIEQIVADTKVDPQGVQRYKARIERGESFRPIVVVQHPSEEVYAVVDGHHRFFAQLELGKRIIEAAVIPDLSGFLFDVVKDGWLQPHPSFTKHVRAPILELQQWLLQRLTEGLRENIYQYLMDFQRDPRQIVKAFREWMDQQIRKS